MDLKKRQEEQFFSPDPQKVFSGVVVCTEDLPLGDSETIKGVVAALGGQSRQALMIEVTHLVCTKPSGVSRSWRPFLDEPSGGPQASLMSRTANGRHSGWSCGDSLDLVRQKKYDRLMQSGWKLGMRAILPHWWVLFLRLLSRRRHGYSIEG